MTSYLKRTQRDCSLAFELAVVDQVEKGEMTVIPPIFSRCQK